MRSLIIALVICLTPAAMALPAAAAAPEESWTLARRVLRADRDATAELLHMLAADEPEVVKRAAKIVRVLGVGHPALFERIINHPELGDAGRRAIIEDLQRMPLRSAKRFQLAALAEQADAIARAASSR